MDKRIIMMDKVNADHLAMIHAHGTVITKDGKNKLLLSFCKSFIDLVNSINPNTTNFFDKLFKHDGDLKKKENLNAHLHIARSYAIHLVDRLNSNPSGDLSMQFMMVAFDYGKLLKWLQYSYDGIVFNGGIGSRNMEIQSENSYGIAAQLFKQFTVSYSVGAYPIFGIRQALEMGAKEILGLDHIAELNSEPYHHATGIPWDFLVETYPHPYLRLRIAPRQMQIIYQWSHRFVHTGKNSNCYVVYHALETIKQLYNSVKVVDENGVNQFYRETMVFNHDKVKQSFQDFLDSKFENKPKVAKWSNRLNLSTLLRLNRVWSAAYNGLGKHVLFPNVPVTNNGSDMVVTVQSTFKLQNKIT